MEEARAYINNKVFGDRLREVSKALLQVEGKTSTEIFGSIDSMKVKSCMTLFDIVSPKVKSYVMTKKELESLREFCVSRWPEKMGATHGIEHWDRVAMFGKMLYQEGADKDVIACFAYLHDSERKDNGIDMEHGLRASLFIDTIRDSYLKSLSDEQIETLKTACEMHTVVPRTGDITVNICFDSDRMDLLRVGILPVPERMATKRGAELVANPNYSDDYDLYVEQAKRGDMSLL